MTVTIVVHTFYHILLIGIIHLRVHSNLQMEARDSHSQQLILHVRYLCLALENYYFYINSNKEQ